MLSMLKTNKASELIEKSKGLMKLNSDLTTL